MVVLFVMVIACSMIPTAQVKASGEFFLPMRASVKPGKTKKLKIKAKGFKVVKVTSESLYGNVTVKASKKSIVVTAKKGTAGKTDCVRTTVKYKKGKYSYERSFDTDIKIAGNQKREVTLADFVGDYRRWDMNAFFADGVNKADESDPTVSTLSASGDVYVLNVTLYMGDSMAKAEVGPFELKDSDMSYEKKYNESNEAYEYILSYTFDDGSYISFTKTGEDNYWLSAEYLVNGELWSEAHLRQ